MQRNSAPSIGNYDGMKSVNYIWLSSSVDLMIVFIIWLWRIPLSFTLEMACGLVGMACVGMASEIELALQ